jgi:hypothetical protein
MLAVESVAWYWTYWWPLVAQLPADRAWPEVMLEQLVQLVAPVQSEATQVLTFIVTVVVAEVVALQDILPQE